uniref:Transmembrane protein n=1 Tax=Caenorhabditis tropicalis TaxID=1561998 RepID=A0A1I7TRC6_9PELO
MDEMWTNHYYPLIHSGVVLFSILSVYFIAYSNIKLALALHGTLKLMILFWTLHSLVFPELYQIQNQEAVAAALYYFLTFVFEMTAFFVINKMNIPFMVDDEDIPEMVDDEDEVMVTCC